MSEPKPITPIELTGVTATFRRVEDAYYLRRNLFSAISTGRSYQNWERTISTELTKLMEDVPATLPLDERIAVAERRIAKQTAIIVEATTKLKEHYGIVFVDDFIPGDAAQPQ